MMNVFIIVQFDSMVQHDQKSKWKTGSVFAGVRAPNALDPLISYSLLHYLQSEIILPLDKANKVTLKYWCQEHLELRFTMEHNL